MFVDSLSRSDLHQKDIREKLPPQLWPFLSKYCLKIWPLKVKCNMYKLVSFERLKKKTYRFTAAPSYSKCENNQR